MGVSQYLRDVQAEVPSIIAQYRMGEPNGAIVLADSIGASYLFQQGLPIPGRPPMVKGDTLTSVEGGYTTLYNGYLVANTNFPPTFGLSVEAVVCKEPNNNGYYVINSPGQFSLAVVGQSVVFSCGLLTNLLANNSFETGLGSWAQAGAGSSGATTTIVEDQTKAWSITSNAAIYNIKQNVNVTAGNTYQYAVYLNNQVNPRAISNSYVINWFNNVPTSIGTVSFSGTPTPPTGIWTPYSLQAVAPAGAVTADVYALHFATGASGDSWVVDNVLFANVSANGVLCAQNVLTGPAQLVTGVYDPVAQLQSIYVDGVLVASQAMSGNMPSAPTSEPTAMYATATVTTSSRAQDVAVYNAPLSANRVAQHFQAMQQALLDPGHVRQYFQPSSGT